MPNTSTSVPYLGASNASMASGPGSRRPSGCASRRPSACPSTASHVSHMSRASHASVHSHASAGLLQQIQTGVVRLLPDSPPRTLRPRTDATPTASPSHGTYPRASTPCPSPSRGTFARRCHPREAFSRSSFSHRVSAHAATVRNASVDASSWLQNAISTGTKTLQDTIKKVPTSFMPGSSR